MQHAVEINVTVVADPEVETGLLLREEPGLAEVALPVLQVVRCVADAELTGEDGIPVVLCERRQAKPDGVKHSDAGVAFGATFRGTDVPRAQTFVGEALTELVIARRTSWKVMTSAS